MICRKTTSVPQPTTRERQFRDRYGPWAVVTGASAGIGAEFARRLAGRGLNVILVARRKDRLEALAAELKRKYGVEARPLAVDLTEPTFMEAIRRGINGLQVGLLVNNAGTTIGGNFLDNDLEPQRRTVELNILAPLLLAHELGQSMRERNRGGIIFVSSLFALQGVPNFANYAATKSYNLGLAEGLAYELRRSGVDVLSVIPGPTLTEGTINMGALPDKGPMKFRAPDGVAKAALAALGKRPTVVPGAMNRVMATFSSKAMSRSGRTKMWAVTLGVMGMTGDRVSSPQASSSLSPSRRR